MERHFSDNSADSIRAIARAAYQQRDILLLRDAVFELSNFRRSAEARRLLEELTPLLENLQQRPTVLPERDSGVQPSPQWLSGVQTIASRYEVRRRSGSGCVYLVLLRGPKSPDGFGVYVGETSITPEERLEQHLSGYRSSKAVRKWGVRLLRPYFDQLIGLSREDAESIEGDLADALRLQNYWVEGGH